MTRTESPQIKIPKQKKQKGLFAPPKSPKYAKIVKFTTVRDARQSAVQLKAEFKRALTRKKKLKVARVTQYAANRAKAASLKKDLTIAGREDLQQVAEVYDQAASEMFADYPKKK